MGNKRREGREGFEEALRNPGTVREITRKLKEKVEKETVPPDGRCLSCKGLIVSRVLSYFRGRYIGGTPECSKCGRRYPFGDTGQVPLAGVREFIKLMHIIVP